MVCDNDPECCLESVGWDSICAGIAESLCTNLCACAVFGDFSGDGRVNLADFARFQNCYTHTTTAPHGDGCACGDSDGDNDVDKLDFALFQALIAMP